MAIFVILIRSEYLSKAIVGSFMNLKLRFFFCVSMAFIGLPNLALALESSYTVKFSCKGKAFDGLLTIDMNINEWEMQRDSYSPDGTRIQSVKTSAVLKISEKDLGLSTKLVFPPAPYEVKDYTIRKQKYTQPRPQLEKFRSNQSEGVSGPAFRLESSSSFVSKHDTLGNRMVLTFLNGQPYRIKTETIQNSYDFSLHKLVRSVENACVGEVVPLPEADLLIQEIISQKNIFVKTGCSSQVAAYDRKTGRPIYEGEVPDVTVSIHDDFNKNVIRFSGLNLPGYSLEYKDFPDFTFDSVSANELYKFDLQTYNRLFNRPPVSPSEREHKVILLTVRTTSADWPYIRLYRVKYSDYDIFYRTILEITGKNNKTTTLSDVPRC